MFSIGRMTCTHNNVADIVTEYVVKVQETYGGQIRNGTIRTTDELPVMVVYQDGRLWARFDFNEAYELANHSDLLPGARHAPVPQEERHRTLLHNMWALVLRRFHATHGPVCMHAPVETPQ